MKYCSYCGAELANEDAAFCSACGKQLSSAKEIPQENPSVEKTETQLPAQETPRKEKKKAKKPKGKRKRGKKTEEPIPEIVGEPVDDGYDGYYNDVLPPDLDRVKEGVDKELVKRIAILAGASIFIIGLCVGMMYIV